MNTSSRWQADGRWISRPGAGDPPWTGCFAESFAALTVQGVRAAVASQEPPTRRTRRDGVRDCAVLIVVFEIDADARVVFVQRSEHVGSHRGEVAFPGGVLEAGETPVAGALREAWEEIGLDPDAVDVVGRLRDFPATGSGFFITPVVAVASKQPGYVINYQEIDSVFDVSLPALLEPGIYREEVWSGEGSESTVPFFEIEGRTIWGATATMLLDLLATVTGGGDWSTHTLPAFRQ